MSWYLEVLKKYAEFNGRARRKEYWMFALFNCIFYFAYGIVAMVAVAAMSRNSASSASSAALLVFIPLWLYGLAVFIPSLAVTIRRLHDTGKSGWWCLISFVPFVGGIILLVFMCADSQPGPNQFGPNPKGEQAFAQYSPAVPRY